MTDLREQMFVKPLSADEKVFLDYHRNSPWAVEKVKQGVHLFPESVAYMQRELDERARVLADYQQKLKEESADATQRAPETHAPEPDAERGPAAAPVGGLPGPGSQSA